MGILSLISLHHTYALVCSLGEMCSDILLWRASVNQAMQAVHLSRLCYPIASSYSLQEGPALLFAMTGSNPLHKGSADKLWVKHILSFTGTSQNPSSAQHFLSSLTLTISMLPTSNYSSESHFFLSFWGLTLDCIISWLSTFRWSQNPWGLINIPIWKGHPRAYDSKSGVEGRNLEF